MGRKDDPLSWRESQADYRRRLLDTYDAAEVERYDSIVGVLSAEDEDAYLADLERLTSFSEGAAVLDVGSGTGTMCRLLARLPGLSICALEPAPAMIAVLEADSGLEDVEVVRGFCDSAGDRDHFPPSRFDVVVSRQVGNTLFDPVAAFENWSHWLRPGGTVVLIDGLYTRSSWGGAWEDHADVLPVSASQSLATLPYLLELAGFEVEAVEEMRAVNDRPSTRTKRFVVVARKPA